MSVYRPKHSRFYLYDFQLDGHRFHGPTGQTSKRAAEDVETERRDQARADRAAARGETAQLKGASPLTLDVAAGKWWAEVGQHRADAKDCWRALERMIAHFGKDRRLDAITDPDIAAWVAQRRGDRVWGKSKLEDGRPAPLVSAATVNRTTVDALRRIFGRARKSWKIAIASEPDWAVHRLEEPEERVRELEQHEQDALTEVAHPDYERVYRFARLSGLRLASCLLRKSHVLWGLGRIEIKGKGGKLNRVPISDAMATVLREAWGDHPEVVFTYVAARTRKDADAPGRARIRGERYPITKAGLETQFARDREEAAEISPSIMTFRFHDNRHTAATRVLRSSKNLKTVQRVLNHSRISTTAKYAHVLDEEVLEALNATPDHDGKSRTESRTKGRDVA